MIAHIFRSYSILHTDDNNLGLIRIVQYSICTLKKIRTFKMYTRKHKAIHLKRKAKKMFIFLLRVRVYIIIHISELISYQCYSFFGVFMCSICVKKHREKTKTKEMLYLWKQKLN